MEDLPPFFFGHICDFPQNAGRAFSPEECTESCPFVFSNKLSAIIKGAGLREGQLPVVFVGNQKDEVVFVSQGYTIGMGAKIAALAKKL